MYQVYQREYSSRAQIMSRVNFPVPTIIIISFPPLLLLSPFFMRTVLSTESIDNRQITSSHHHECRIQTSHPILQTSADDCQTIIGIC